GEDLRLRCRDVLGRLLTRCGRGNAAHDAERRMNRSPLKPARRRKCKTCREWFRPHNTLQKTCSPRCALDFARTQGDKIARAAIKRQREKLLTRSDWIKRAQKEFNAYVRLRDAGKPCICCGRYAVDNSL